MKELDTSWLHRPVYTLLMLALTCVAFAPFVSAHSPVVDADLSDWCLGAFSNTGPGGGRIEDSAATLTCGNCFTATDTACTVNSDCPAGDTCVDLTHKTEVVWWDNRTDGAVNDLGTVAMTRDNENLYIAAELWVDPDPLSLPFGEIAIDYAPGGLHSWHDPFNNLINPGHCSTFTDRACTSDADCHFCAESTEPFPSTRVRTCGSGCNPDIPTDVCQMDQTCEGLGDEGLKQIVGGDSWPEGGAEYLLLFDFSFWLSGAEQQNSVMLTQPAVPADGNLWGVAGFPLVGFADPKWNPVFGCAPDFAGDETECDFVAAVNPGASGGSGGPPGSIEVAIPWEAFGCTGCPTACSCPGFGPDVPFRFNMIVARGTLSLDFTPDGAHEDVMSEAVASTTTTSLDNCPGFGTVNTDCELADGSADAYVPRTPALTHEIAAGGRTSGLHVTKNGGGSITLDWGGSCSSGDTDFGVYEGTIGSFMSHIPVPGMCSTAGATSAMFNPFAGDRYFLVVPSNGSTEGSYGGDDITGERPVSATPCAAQILGDCP